jgi:hypothetical protein
MRAHEDILEQVVETAAECSAEAAVEELEAAITAATEEFEVVVTAAKEELEIAVAAAMRTFAKTFPARLDEELARTYQPAHGESFNEFYDEEIAALTAEYGPLPPPAEEGPPASPPAPTA